MFSGQRPPGGLEHGRVVVARGDAGRPVGEAGDGVLVGVDPVVALGDGRSVARAAVRLEQRTDALGVAHPGIGIAALRRSQVLRAGLAADERRKRHEKRRQQHDLPSRGAVY